MLSSKKNERKKVKERKTKIAKNAILFQFF